MFQIQIMTHEKQLELRKSREEDLNMNNKNLDTKTLKHIDEHLLECFTNRRIGKSETRIKGAWYFASK